MTEDFESILQGGSEELAARTSGLPPQWSGLAATSCGAVTGSPPAHWPSLWLLRWAAVPSPSPGIPLRPIRPRRF